jgi:hypothetical protein
MDLGFARWRESQRVFGHLENIGLEKSAIKKGARSDKPYQIRPVVRGAGNKKGQPRAVDLLLLVGIINMKFRSEEKVLLLSIGHLELF